MKIHINKSNYLFISLLISIFYILSTSHANCTEKENSTKTQESKAEDTRDIAIKKILEKLSAIPKKPEELPIKPDVPKAMCRSISNRYDDIRDGVILE